MVPVKDKIFIGTILLEPNRWGDPKTPTYRVSEWIPRFREAGFDGMELWEYHATRCAAGELAALEASTFPVAVYNTYCGFGDASESDRGLATGMVERLGASGVKFNLGRDPAQRDAYMRNLRTWIESLPDDCRLLCECHGGTIVEESAKAARFFAELGGDRCQIIVHALMADPDLLEEWFRLCGPSITHVHIQLRDEGGTYMRLDRSPARVREALHIMDEEGFQGSFTLEFTEGTRAPNENMENLWHAALSDLHFLRENL